MKNSEEEVSPTRNAHWNAADALTDTAEHQMTKKSLLNASKRIDYGDSSPFTWKTKLSHLLKRTFGIEKLRLCQEGVMNAILDNRDVICIMSVRSCWTA